MKFHARILLVAAFFFAVSRSESLRGETGVTDGEILLGQAAALEGAASGLGTGMQAGMTAFFNKLNADGGIKGRKIIVKSVNDGYEPEQCKLVTTALIKRFGIFAHIGGVGTPTAKVAIPIITENKVPFIGSFTGAELLRAPYNPLVVNVRASYYQEMEALTNLLVDKKGLKKIACFYQNDAHGQAGLDGLVIALKKRNLEPVVKTTYERNTVAVGDGVTAIAEQPTDAVVMVGAYKGCAAFIKSAKKNDKLKSAIFCNTSFVGTNNVLQELGSDADDKCIVSQVVPFPWERSIPVVAEYHYAMEAAGKKDLIGFVSLEGYLVAKFFSQVVAKVEGELTRESLLQTIIKVGKFDLGGFALEFGEKDNQGSDKVFLTTLAGGQIAPLK